MVDTVTPAPLAAAIDADIAARLKAHQAAMARVRIGRSHLDEATLASVPDKPLALLAHGDSWFDYPLNGNDFSFAPTDVIAQLRRMGSPSPLILNMSHHGDATTDELSLPKQQRLIDAIRDPSNWFESGKPDAILFSGGGNDIAGEQFCIFLNYAGAGVKGLNSERFSKSLGAVEASYLDLFAFRDRYCPKVPIIGHSYDFPIPNGAHPACAGPWLLPSLQYCGWTAQQGIAIVREALSAFHTMLQAFEAEPKNNFILVPTQGLLKPADWANELHPTAAGFHVVAEAFAAKLKAKFPSRFADLVT